MTNGKNHLSQADRSYIEASLREGKSLKRIARELGRSTSTVSREIAKHTYPSDKWTYGRGNLCVHRADCRIRGLCVEESGCARRCASCAIRKCNELCGECEYIGCEKRELRPGGVCNGCPDERTCHVRKLYYVAKRAHDDYLRTLRESREGANIDMEELSRIDAIVTPAIMNGQSVHHIFATRAGAFNCNERTVSRYLHYGMFSAKRGDMKRSCMVRQRKPKSADYAHKVERACYAGRDYAAYQAFLAGNPGAVPVFMDLLIGRPGGKCLLTLHWPDAAFMIARVIPNKCAENVTAVFDALYAELGHDLFTRLFGVILTDRGTEFSNPSRIETAADGTPRCRVFFCDPMNSNQKSRLERNHELVREVLPKGVSFDGLTQEDADLVLSHVNAYVRLSKADRTPYDLFEFLHGVGTAARLRIAKVDPRVVCLKPGLLGDKVK